MRDCVHILQVHMVRWCFYVFLHILPITGMWSRHSQTLRYVQDVRSCRLCAYVCTVIAGLSSPPLSETFILLCMYIRTYSSPKSFRKQISPQPVFKPQQSINFKNLTYLPLVKRSNMIGQIRVDSMHITYILYIRVILYIYVRIYVSTCNVSHF